MPQPISPGGVTRRFSRDALRLVVMDDDPIARRMTCEQLREAGGLEIDESATTGATDIAARVAETRPHAVVVDAKGAGARGVVAVRHIVRADPGVAVLMFSAAPCEELVTLAASAGAVASVDKRDGVEALTAAVRRVVSGEAVLPPTVVRALLRWMRSPRAAHDMPWPPTATQWRVLEIACERPSVSVVAEALGVNQATARRRMAEVERLLEACGLALRPPSVALTADVGR